jgi:LuxR family maltose regulon positive regulatory protein
MLHANNQEPVRTDELIEPLTNREMDVLLLLAQRLTNKEIAVSLTLSPRTVQKHTINIYQKLHARNRREAVTRARAAGLLPDIISTSSSSPIV